MQEDTVDVKKPHTSVPYAHQDSVKMEAVKLWLVVGNLRLVSTALDVPYATIRDWRYSNWWNSLSDEIKQESHIQLSGKLKKVAQKALEVMSDRLDNGDYVYNHKTGKIDRKEVNLRDATLAFNSLHDREVRLEATPQEEQKAVVDRLAALASKFEEIANKRVVQVTDVIYKETP